MDLRSFYKGHPYVAHYLLTVPLLILIVIGLNVITQTPVDRIPEVIAASFFFPIPILIGLAAARIGTKNIIEDKNAEVAFLTIWILVANALPIFNLLLGQSLTGTLEAMLPVTVVLLLNYSFRRSMS